MRRALLVRECPMTRRLFTAVLVLSGFLGLIACPRAGAQDSITKESPKQVKAYDLLQTKSTKHEIGDAYLLAYASCYVFPDLLGVKDRNDHKNFTEVFAAKFIPLGIKRVHYVSDVKTSTEVIVMTTDAAVIVVFRGSEIGDNTAFIKDWLTNVKAWKVDTPSLRKGAKVHSGMWKSEDSVHKYVVKEVEEQGGFSKKRVYVTGHSLGGGLALISAVRMHVEGKGKATVYTFGSPRTGNHEFRLAAGDLEVHRWVNGKDLVPMLPSDKLLDYRHVGLTHNIKDNNEIYLDDAETRAAKGDPYKHHVYHYLRGLYANLPSDLKSQMPESP